MREMLRSATYYLAFGSALSIVFSIAISQILLALSLAALLLSNEKLTFPPLCLPLAAFFLTTLVSAAFSIDPWGGAPQIRKFFVFAMILVMYSTFKTVRQVQTLVLVWAGAGSLSAVWGLAQFLHRRQEALEQRADQYTFLLDGRMTGFTGHWMTFGGEEMIVLLMLTSYLLFSNQRGWKLFGWPALAVLCVSITLGMTRSIFLLGVPAGLSYLLWHRSRTVLIGTFLVAAIGIALAPAAIHERVISVFKPHEGVDSNTHHAICRMVGWEMIKAHPWLGLGPEQVGKQFDRYVPSATRRPLPRGWYGHLHNVYLQYAAERGVPALLSIMWLIAKVVRDLLKYLKNGSPGAEEKAILYGAIAVIGAVLAEGLFEHNLGDSEVLTLFLSVVACGYVVVRRGRQADKISTIPREVNYANASVTIEAS